MVSFGLGAALAGAAGGIAGMLYTIYPYMGLQYLLKSFVVVVIGGLGSLVGAVIGGIGFRDRRGDRYVPTLVERGDDDRIRPARRRADRASAGTVRPQ